MKRRWIIGLVLALGILSGLGAIAVSAASLPGGQARQVRGADQRPGEERRSQFLERLAQKLGVTTDQLRQAIQETRGELGGNERGPRAFRRGQDGNAPGRFGFRGGDGERGPGRPGAFGGGAPMMQARMFLGEEADIVTNMLGISREQLRQELRGNTLEGVARAHGVNPQSLSDALLSNLQRHLAQAVAEGHITQDRADQMQAHATEMIQRFMTFQIPDDLPRRGQAPNGGVSTDLHTLYYGRGV